MSFTPLTGPGTEQRTNGLWVHHGKLSVGPPGGNSLPGDLNVNRGSNAGAIYFGGVGNRYLFYDGTQFQLAGGPLSATLAPGTATSALGSYRAAAGYNVPAINTWYESNAQVSVTTAGGRIRADASGSITSAAAGALLFVGFGVDGGLTYDGLVAASIPAVNYVVPYGFTCYVQPGAGLHRFSIWLYASSASTTGLYAGAYQNLWITEQKA